MVSVIMPVYNAGQFLSAAIESIVNQTFHDFEFIIVDDASTDNSWQIIKSYQKKHPGLIRPVKLRINRNNGGDACANQGYKIARGEYIARMDADDIAHPQRLEKQIDFMKKNQDIILCGTQAYVIDRDNRITGQKCEPTEDSEIRKNYFIFHPIIHPTVMIRKSMLPKRSYLYKICFNANNDLLTFFELLNCGKFANLPEKLLFYRIHGKNDSLINPKGRFLNTLRIRLYAWKSLNYRPTVSGIFMNIAQTLIMIIMPSDFVTRLYMWWRGLSKPHKAPLSFALEPTRAL